MSKAAKIFAFLLFVFAVVMLFFFNSGNAQKKYFQEEGYVFGTIYHITYEADSQLTPDIKNALQRVDNSLSMFNENSTISKINRGEDVALDSLFLRVFSTGEQVSLATDGAFDMTVAPLVNFWGFGFEARGDLDQTKLDEIMQAVGYQKVRIADGKVIKDNPNLMLDASAIAKGFACDVVADALKEKGVENYLVEIGGEVAVSGHNAQGSAWRVGINKPIDDSTSVHNEIQQVVELSAGGMATSGNYRNFYIENGQKLAHTIDPKTGRPVQHVLLSATIVANDCMTADACATACMVMGLDESLKFCEHFGVEGYFIYSLGEEYLVQTTSHFPLK